MIIPERKMSIMEEVRRKNKKPETIKQKLSFTLLDLIASYIISENRNIRKKGYVNIQSVINLIDESQYQEEASKERLEFIKSGLEARLKYNLVWKDQVVDYINNSQATTPKWNINLHELSNDEVHYIDETVSHLLDTASFSNMIGEFEGLSHEYDIASISHQQDIVEKWKQMVANANNRIRFNKIEKSDEEIFSLSKNFDDYARTVHADLCNPSSQLSTGMTGLNYLLNGGFENGRVYCFFGLQGEGKSTTLLNLAKQIKDYNKFFKPKDPTKIPAVVYLTLENRKKETFTRLFTISTGIDEFNSYDVEEALKIAKEDGNLVVNSDSPIDIIVKFKPNNSVDTSYLYELYDDLAEQGYEVICFIVDYLKRIRSIERYTASEERLKLGAVVNEFKTIATDLDIPIITASQFNRDANAKIDEARSNNSAKNLVNLLGRQNIGESMLILDNVDAGLMISPEYLNKGTEKYLGIKLAKSRYRPNLKALNGSSIIHQPYDSPTGIMLLTDVGKAPIYKLDLNEAVEMNTAPITVVDNKVKLPDNSDRCGKPKSSEPYKPVKTKKKQEKKKKEVIYLDDNGIPLDYNPNWRNEPKYVYMQGVGDVMNVDALPPEQQIRFRRNANVAMSNDKSKPIELQGYSRYSNEYTLLYDPDGSKEERMVYDYNMIYGENLTVNECPYIEEHIKRVKLGINSTDTFDVPLFTEPPKPDTVSLFLNLPNKVEREFYIKNIG